jgi:hypothetical protein
MTLATSLAACGSSSSGGAPAPKNSPALANSAAGKAAATAQIKTTWATFFKSGTPLSVAVPLLQNGGKLSKAVTYAAHVAKVTKMKESARVSKVTFTDARHANVTYDLIGNGKPVLAGATGNAVLVGNTWQIAQNTFCTLVDLGAQTLGDKNPPGC